MEVGAGGADNAVRRPAVHEVGFRGEVRPGIDVMVAGGHHMVVGMGCGSAVGDVTADGRRDLGAAGHGQAAALAEVVLDVDDDERGFHCTTFFSVIVGDRRRPHAPVSTIT